MWRWRDGDNYYVARANALENNVSLYYTENGSRKTLKYVDAPVAANAWHTLRVDFELDAELAPAFALLTPSDAYLSNHGSPLNGTNDDFTGATSTSACGPKRPRSMRSMTARCTRTCAPEAPPSDASVPCRAPAPASSTGRRSVVDSSWPCTATRSLA